MFAGGALADRNESGHDFGAERLEVAGGVRLASREVESRYVDVAVGADMALEGRVVLGRLMSFHWELHEEKDNIFIVRKECLYKNYHA